MQDNGCLIILSVLRSIIKIFQEMTSEYVFFSVDNLPLPLKRLTHSVFLA